MFTYERPARIIPRIESTGTADPCVAAARHADQSDGCEDCECSRYTHISLSLRSLSQVKLHKPSVRNTVSSRTAEGLPSDDFPHHANRPVRRAVIGEHPHCAPHR